MKQGNNFSYFVCVDNLVINRRKYLTWNKKEKSFISEQEQRGDVDSLEIMEKLLQVIDDNHRKKLANKFPL